MELDQSPIQGYDNHKNKYYMAITFASVHGMSGSVNMKSTMCSME